MAVGPEDRRPRGGEPLDRPPRPGARSGSAGPRRRARRAARPSRGTPGSSRCGSRDAAPSGRRPRGRRPAPRGPARPAASTSPVRRTRRSAEPEREDERAVVLGGARVRLRSRVEDVEDDARRDEPVSRAERLDRDSAGAPPRRAPRRGRRSAAPRAARRRRPTGQQPRAPRGGRARGRGAGASGRRRRTRRPRAPRGAAGAASGRSRTRRRTSRRRRRGRVPVGDDEERVSLPDVEGDELRLPRPLGRGGPGRDEEDERESPGEGHAARPSRRGASRPRRGGAARSAASANGGVGTTRDGAERVEEPQEADDRLREESERAEGERGRERPREEEREEERRAANRKRLASGTTTRFERRATNGTTWKTVAWIGKTQSSAPSVAATPSASASREPARGGAARRAARRPRCRRRPRRSGGSRRRRGSPGRAARRTSAERPMTCAGEVGRPRRRAAR